MTFKILINLSFMLCSVITFGQTYRPITMKGGNGTLSKTDGLMDNDQYSVLIFQFMPRTSIFTFLDPDQNEISRYQIEAANLTVKGYSASAKEFIVYFEGKFKSSKSRSYFVAFFKDKRPPVFSEWLDISDNGSELFSYSYDDKFFIAKSEKETGILRIHEVLTVNSVKTRSYQLSESTLNKIGEHVDVNYAWGNFIKHSVNMVVPLKDSLQIIFLDKGDESEERALRILSFNLMNESVKTHSIVFEEYNTPAASLVDELFFVFDTGKTFDKYFSINVYDLKSFKKIKEYKIDREATTSKYEFGPLLDLRTGKTRFEKDSLENTKKILKAIGDQPAIIGVNKTRNDFFSLRVGGEQQIQNYTTSGASGPVGTGYRSNVPVGIGYTIDYAFSLTMDQHLNIVDSQVSDDYLSCLESFREISAQKVEIGSTKADKNLYFISNSTTIISFYYSDKTNETYLAKINRQVSN
jgi:hypothetical protein